MPVWQIASVVSSLLLGASARGQVARRSVGDKSIGLRGLPFSMPLPSTEIGDGSFLTPTWLCPVGEEATSRISKNNFSEMFL